VAARHQRGGDDWPPPAAANGIEDPRRLTAGQMIDLQAGLPSRR